MPRAAWKQQPTRTARFVGHVVPTVFVYPVGDELYDAVSDTVFKLTDIGNYTTRYGVGFEQKTPSTAPGTITYPSADIDLAPDSGLIVAVPASYSGSDQKRILPYSATLHQHGVIFDSAGAYFHVRDTSVAMSMASDLCSVAYRVTDTAGQVCYADGFLAASASINSYWSPSTTSNYYTNSPTKVGSLGSPCLLMAYWSGTGLPDELLAEYSQNPWALLAPRPARFILIPSAGGSGLFITPADLEHAQTIDAGILTQAHLLAANKLSHNQSISAATIIASGTLSPAGLEHDQVIDASALVQDHQLTPDGLQHINTLGEAALIQAHSLIPAGLDHVHTLDAPILAQAHVITPATLTHTHSVAVATLELSGTLSPDGLTHQQALDFATLVQAHVITPARLEHGHELTLAELSQATILIADNLAHLQTLASPALSVGLSITPGGLVHVQSLDDATLTQAYILLPADLAHVQTLSAAQISTGNIYVPAGRVIVIGASDRYLVITPSDRTILLS